MTPGTSRSRWFLHRVTLATGLLIAVTLIAVNCRGMSHVGSWGRVYFGWPWAYLVQDWGAAETEPEHWVLDYLKYGPRYRPQLQWQAPQVVADSALGMILTAGSMLAIERSCRKQQSSPMSLQAVMALVSTVCTALAVWRSSFVTARWWLEPFTIAGTGVLLLAVYLCWMTLFDAANDLFRPAAGAGRPGRTPEQKSP
jgi:hypothetical protein